MLPSPHRLTKKKDFEKVFKTGKSFDGKIVFFKISKNDLGATRFGFIVSKKISKKAVARNKIKRRLRAIISAQLKKIKPGFDVIIAAKPGIIESPYQELKEVINKIFRKSKLLKL